MQEHKLQGIEYVNFRTLFGIWLDSDQYGVHRAGWAPQAQDACQRITARSVPIVPVCFQSYCSVMSTLHFAAYICIELMIN